MREDVSYHLQDSLILLAIIDTDFLKVVSGQVPPEFFTSDITQYTYKLIINFYQRYKKAPKDNFFDYLYDKIEKVDDNKKEIIARYLSRLSEMDTPDKDFVLGSLNDFIKERTYISAAYKFAESVESGKFEEATYIMQNALKSGIANKNIGVDLLGKQDDLAERGKIPERAFSLGIEEIDKYIRIENSELVTIAGPYKGGKSWFGHHIGRHCLLEGKNVIHVSHENSLRDTTIRYDMMFGGLISDHHEPDNVELVECNKVGNIVGKEIRLKDTVFNKKLVEKQRKVMGSFGGKLIVKKYPMGTCTPMELESFLNYVESYENIKPDVVINDYADIMAPISNTMQTRDAINEVYKYLKRIADEKKLVMITMSQINDEGLRTLVMKGKLEGRHLAEDKRKFATIDKGFFVGTTPEFELNNEAIVGCFANRNGMQGISCVIGQNLRIGQFCCYSYLRKRGE